MKKVDGLKEIEIGRVKSPKEFYFVENQWRETYQQEFQEMSCYFQTHPPSKIHRSMLVPKLRVLIKNLAQLNSWTRAETIKISDSGNCKVMILDTGEVEEDIDISALYKLPNRYRDWPPIGASRITISGTISLK